ncbi:NRDE-2, necessary for RNA interference-domain-containing protein [Gymnopilus junonius]|uniref:NRDE-2, necessary for RNA interference-domain-containing protein n=1 Tax=Gymnopilus junonius TaxID=109634 RepID=A0A9P5P2Z8_GYMJU|nr:NRDE-2, necessary for RNA interference-domain-containing protein [Gymnopilus junonius]
MSSSLPPSFSSFPDLEAGPSTRITESLTTSSHDKRRRKRHDSPEHQSDAKASKRRHKSFEKEHRIRRDGNDSEVGQYREHERVNLAFYSDRKGDLKNIQYGGLHSGDIPKYRLVAGGRSVLGLPQALVIVKRAGKGVEIGASYQRKAPSLTSTGSRALLSRPPSRRIPSSSRADQYNEVDGVVCFPSQRSTRHKEDSYRPAIVSSHRDDSDSSPYSDSDAAPSSDESSDSLVLTAQQETLKRLEQELEARPENTDIWNSLLNESLSTIPVTSKNATKARSEITLSILSRAFSASPQNAMNKNLRLAYLKAGEQVWHESKLRSEWEEALEVGDVEFQVEWLEWRIKNGSGGIDQVIDSALRTYEGLGPGRNSEWYIERAMAAFQAQAELIFNAPPSITGMDFQAQLDKLEEFWDSECSRFGEDGAQGWASWHSSRNRAPVSTNGNLQPRIIKDLDPYRQWANQELEMDVAIYLPLRSDSDSLDPYSTVLFADIRSLMLDVTSPRAKNAFRMAWLSFMGLHVPGFSLATNREIEWDDRWNLGYLTRPPYLDAIFPSSRAQTNIMTDAVAGAIIGREREFSSPFGPVRCWGKDVSLPLDLSSGEPGKVLQWALWTKRDLATVDEAFVRRLFASLRTTPDDPEWDTLALAFELAVNPKNAVKLSKSLLSTNQDSLALWDAHAQLERRRGRVDSARKLYETILISSKPHSTQEGVGRLYSNWVEMEWLAGNDQQALGVILKSVDLSGLASGVAILRTKRSLEDAAESARAWKEQEAWVKLRALLELLTGNEPEAAFTVFDKYLLGENDSSIRESLTTASLVIVYCYGTILKRPMAPSILRERAHTAFAHYPSNSIILGILLETEKGQGVWGRIRSMLGGNDGKIKGVARRIEEVWLAGWEKGRWLGEVERTRNGLAAAVEHERTRYSFVIWRIYIEFEIRAGELERAKKLLFRAIGDCPLVKELYLLAFGPLRSVFKNHELQGLADTMVERGIRLRQGLDEVVQGQGVTGHGERGSDEESADEIEHNAKELRRLMPY